MSKRRFRSTHNIMSRPFCCFVSYSLSRSDTNAHTSPDLSHDLRSYVPNAARFHVGASSSIGNWLWPYIYKNLSASCDQTFTPQQSGSVGLVRKGWESIRRQAEDGNVHGHYAVVELFRTSAARREVACQQGMNRNPCIGQCSLASSSVTSEKRLP